MKMEKFQLFLGNEALVILLHKMKTKYSYHLYNVSKSLVNIFNIEMTRWCSCHFFS